MRESLFRNGLHLHWGVTRGSVDPSRGGIGLMWTRLHNNGWYFVLALVPRFHRKQPVGFAFGWWREVAFPSPCRNGCCAFSTIANHGAA